ncbi:YdeI/OmpD-associated family protein [Brevibacillus dissolubilis]|uniref:YdeI/OmpD-associated family protein n=1 Tax=Brevibacillus dissolubilis TaxID=1844116 RepID=UPI00159B86A3|nr:YdeI/OmpD-associated family protein [Brevibacillus dissolubilis]
MSTDLQKKLRIKSGQRLTIINAPHSYLDLLGPLPDDVESAGIETGGEFDLVQLFIHNIAELDELAPQALKAVKRDGLLWICYPKKSAKTIKTDITRDHGWQTVTQAGFEGIALVSIDDTWSALRFRPADLVKSTSPSRSSDPTSSVRTSTAERILIIPEELEQAFSSHPQAKEFFDTLSYTNRKEYVVWITSAKRAETKEKRLAQTIEKLEQGVKNPHR